jgi:DNA segregation ATPase FtsK/SpoIIIE-like protein
MQAAQQQQQQLQALQSRQGSAGAAATAVGSLGRPVEEQLLDFSFKLPTPAGNSSGRSGLPGLVELGVPLGHSSRQDAEQEQLQSRSNGKAAGGAGDGITGVIAGGGVIATQEQLQAAVLASISHSSTESLRKTGSAPAPAAAGGGGEHLYVAVGVLTELQRAAEHHQAKSTRWKGRCKHLAHQLGVTHAQLQQLQQQCAGSDHGPTAEAAAEAGPSQATGCFQQGSAVTSSSGGQALQPSASTLAAQQQQQQLLLDVQRLKEQLATQQVLAAVPTCA